MNSRVALFCIDGSGMGGIARAFLALAKVLETHGWACKVVLQSDAEYETTIVPHEYIIGSGWRRTVVGGWRRFFYNVVNVLTGQRYAFRHATRCPHDVFVCYGTAANYMWWRYSKAPRIMWIHNMVGTGNPDTLRQWLSRIGKAMNYRNFDYVVAVGSKPLESWRKYYHLHQPCEVIANIFDVDGVQTKADEPCEITEQNRPQVVCVTRFSFEKGVDRLLRAAKAYAEEGGAFDLWILGDGPMLKESVEFVVENRLMEVVHLVGRKNNPYPYIKKANSLILPSRSEATPVVFNEALVLGCPVVAVDCGGVREALRNGAWGRLVENSEEGVLTALRLACGERSKLLPTKSFEHITEELRQKNREAIMQTLNLFDRLVSSNQMRGDGK